MTDGKNQTTRWKYDAYGRVTNKLDQAGAAILRYTYDAGSRLRARWSGAKGTTQYAYDPAGNLTNIDYPASVDVRFTYDAMNRLKTMVDAAGTSGFAYWPGGALKTEDGPWASDTLTNTYRNGLRTGLSLQQPTGLWTNGFTYDAGGRLGSLTSPAGTFSNAYTPPGFASALTRQLALPNNAAITNAYDAVGRLLTTHLRTSAGVLTNAHAYLYNLAGQRTRQTYVNGDYADYTYDPLGQLRTALSYTSGGVALASQWRGYTYDTAWNLSWRTNGGLAQWFRVDAKNELTNSAVTTVQTFDLNGNLLTRAANSWTFAYDDENRLVALSNNAAGLKTTLTYDGLGRLRIRQEWGLSNAPPAAPAGAGGMTGQSPQPLALNPWTLLSETHYIYDGRRVMQERDGSNTPAVSYTRGRDLSGTLEGAGGIGGLLGRSAGYNGANGRWSSHAYYHADGNGNITFLMNSNQTLAASYRYDPYGNRVASRGPLADANLYRFSSKEFHANSGLYYYLYRWYDPTTQRWMNRDPMGELGGLNLYRPLANDPINKADPHGDIALIEGVILIVTGGIIVAILWDEFERLTEPVVWPPPSDHDDPPVLRPPNPDECNPLPPWKIPRKGFEPPENRWPPYRGHRPGEWPGPGSRPPREGEVVVEASPFSPVMAIASSVR